MQKSVLSKLGNTRIMEKLEYLEKRYLTLNVCIRNSAIGKLEQLANPCILVCCTNTCKNDMYCTLGMYRYVQLSYVRYQANTFVRGHLYNVRNCASKYQAKVSLHVKTFVLVSSEVTTEQAFFVYRSMDLFFRKSNGIPAKHWVVASIAELSIPSDWRFKPGHKIQMTIQLIV